MDCDDAARQIYLYLDGELTTWKRRAIARHLDDCPPCAQGFSFEIELRQVIVSKCHEQVPDELRRRIAEQINFDPRSDLGEAREAAPRIASENPQGAASWPERPGAEGA